MKRSSPYFLWLWAALLAGGLLGLPRVVRLGIDFLTLENDFDGIKSAVTGIVLLVNAPFLLAVIWAILFRPRKAAFTRKGFIGASVAVGAVFSVFAVQSLSRATYYPVEFIFTDVQNEPLRDIQLQVKREVRGLTRTTSYRTEENTNLPDGHVKLKRARDESILATVKKDGFVSVEVRVNPMVAPYPRGPLQKIDIGWTQQAASILTAKNWSFLEGPLQIPVMKTGTPMTLPLPKYSEDDWKVIERQGSGGK